MTDQEKSLISIARFFDENQIDYMVIGGIANAIWGNPRSTLDIDVSIWAETEGTAPVALRLATAFSCRVAAPVEFVARTRVLPLTSAEGTPLDVVFALLPFEREAITRAVVRQVGDQPVRTVWKCGSEWAGHSSGAQANPEHSISRDSPPPHLLASANSTEYNQSDHFFVGGNMCIAGQSKRVKESAVMSTGRNAEVPPSGCGGQWARGSVGVLAVLLALGALGIPGEACAGDGLLPIRLHLGGLVTLEDGSKDSLHGPGWMGEGGVSLALLPMLEVGVNAGYGANEDANTVEFSAWTRYRISVPLVTLFAGVGVGYLWKEVSGSDWVFNDEGLIVQPHVGAEMAILSNLSVGVRAVLDLLNSDAHQRNSSYPEWVPIWRLGVEVVYSM